MRPNSSDAPEVVITGAGVVTCLGASRTATLDALRRGERVRGAPLPCLAGTPHAGCLGAQEPEWDVAAHVAAHVADRRMRKFMSRHAELAAIAARQALAEADSQGRGIPADRVGLYAGVGLAATDLRSSADLLRNSLDSAGDFNLERFAHSGLPTIHPLWSFHTLPNMPACIVSVLEGIQGDNAIYSPWEDQTAFALLEAAHALERGDIDRAVVVASDTPAHPACLAELALAGHIAPPEVAASGAACLVLERPDKEPSVRTLAHLRDLRLAALSRPAPRPRDPLAPFIGRTVAAAPLLLIALAPFFDLPRRLDGCGGHSFSFEAVAGDG